MVVRMMLLLLCAACRSPMEPSSIVVETRNMGRPTTTFVAINRTPNIVWLRACNGQIGFATSGATGTPISVCQQPVALVTVEPHTEVTSSVTIPSAGTYRVSVTRDDGRVFTSTAFIVP